MITKIKNIFAACLVCIGITAALTACDDDHTGSIDVSGSCLVEKFVLNGKYEGMINTEKRLIKIKVPVDFNQKGNMEITSLDVSSGAKTNLKVGDRVNFDADRTLHITNGDLEMDYQISVRNDEALLSLFILEGVKGAINQDDKTVTVSVMANSGIDLENATFEVVCSEDGDAENVELLNDEEKAAAKWLTGSIEGAAYASWDMVASGSISLDECKFIFFHRHSPAYGNYNGFAEAATGAMTALPVMKDFWKRGGAFVLSRSAVNYAIALGAMPADAYPNNCWGGGGGEGSDLMGDDPWHFFAYDVNHPLWKNLKAYPGAAPDAVYTLDNGYTICNTTSQFALWNPYTGQEAFETITGARALSHGGDGAVVAWELKAADGNFGKGGIICFGSGLFDWNSPTPYTSVYHDNMGGIMLNAFDYLTK